MKKYKKFFPLISGILFLLTTVTSVALAWISDVHRYDLAVTFSGYVGLRRSTSIMYFVAALIMIPMLIYYIAKTQMRRAKRVIYSLVLVCIFGTAFFPYNYYSDAPTAFSIDMHNYFAIALMLTATVSFIFTAVVSKNKKQRITAVLSIVYAVSFILLFAIGFSPLFRTIFIWENLFILLLLVGMYSEQFEELANGTGER